MGPAAWSASPARKQAVQQAVDTGPGRGQQCQLRVPSPAAAATRHLHAPCLMDPHRTLRRGDGRSEPICPGHSVDKGSNMTVGFGEADSHRNPVSGTNSPSCAGGPNRTRRPTLPGERAAPPACLELRHGLSPHLWTGSNSGSSWGSSLQACRLGLPPLVLLDLPPPEPQATAPWTHLLGRVQTFCGVCFPEEA